MPITGKAPVSYADWHELYHQFAKTTGFVAVTYGTLRMLKAPAVILNDAVRRYWRLVFRMKRIDRRMDEARERNDVTYQRHSAFVESLIRELNDSSE